MRIPSITRTAKSAGAKRSLTLLGVLAAFVALGGYAVAAPRGPAVAAPSITSGPSGATRATSASFAFRGARGDTFECALDGAGFAACASPKTYAGPLSSGAHAFQVRARDARGQLSAPASREWRVDTTAPAITIWHPLDGGAFNAPEWSLGCFPGPRICGAASDAAGVASVAISIRRQATGLWWNGTSYAAARETFLAATGTDSWGLRLPLPPADGGYVVHVRATDQLGNATAPGSERAASFTIDRQPPPAPSIVEGPSSLTASDDATFRFADAEPGVGYLCRLDSDRDRDWDYCANPQTFRRLRDGLHTLSVRAYDAASNVSAPITRSWRVDTDAPPKPRITQKPAASTSEASATLGFTDGESGVAFECRLDGAAWAACTSPRTYTGLGIGRHSFAVRALDAAGNRSGAADWEWSISQANGQSFVVRGDLTGTLAPGLSGTLELTVANPNDEAIVITSLTVTVQPGSTNPGCDGPRNLAVTQSSASVANPLSVPAHGTLSVPSGSVSAPQVAMLNLPTNQDACKGATFTFSYGGSAHS